MDEISPQVSRVKCSEKPDLVFLVLLPFAVVKHFESKNCFKYFEEWIKFGHSKYFCKRKNYTISTWRQRRISSSSLYIVKLVVKIFS